MNCKQAFGFQSLELGEGLKRCLHVRSHPFSCVSNPRLIPKLLCSITIHTSLGVKTVAERDGHSLDPDLFASTPRPFLALNANAVDIEIKWLLPAAGPSCMQPSAFRNFAVGPGCLCQLTTYSQGRSLRPRFPCDPADSSSHGLWNTTDHSCI